MEYSLGTFGALKYYAWKYLQKSGEAELAEIYKAVYDAWQQAFSLKTSQDVTNPEVKAKIAALLKSAYENEIKAVEIMEKE